MTTTGGNRSSGQWNDALQHTNPGYRTPSPHRGLRQHSRRLDVCDGLRPPSKFTAMPEHKHERVLQHAGAQLSATLDVEPAEIRREETTAPRTSPQKYLVYNQDIERKLEVDAFARMSDGLVALRVLVDALVYKCGYREVEWTDSERVAWEERKTQVGATRRGALFSKKTELAVAGLTTADIFFLSSNAGRLGRNRQNEAAHNRPLWVAALQLSNLIKTEKHTIQNAINAAFGYLSNSTIAAAIQEKDNRILTAKGVEEAWSDSLGVYYDQAEAESKEWERDHP